MNILLPPYVSLPLLVTSKSPPVCVALLIALSVLVTELGPSTFRGDEPPRDASPGVESANSESANSESASKLPTGDAVIASDASRDDKIETWIGEWEAASFAVRRAASRQLESAGLDAYDLLADAAIQRTPETRARALAILERGLRQSDAKLKAASRESVERIAASGNASAARAAQELLRETESPAATGSNVRRGNPIGVPVGIAGLGGGAVNRQIRLPEGTPKGWPIGPIPPNPQAWPEMGGMPPAWMPGGMPGNPIAAQQAEVLRTLRVLQLLDSSIARTRIMMMQTADPAQRARLQRQLEQSQETRQRLQAIMPLR